MRNFIKALLSDVFLVKSRQLDGVYIYILLDGLHVVCSIVGYFTSHAVFWRARRASQNTRDE